MPDYLSVELEITDAGADVVLSRTKQKLDDFVNDVEKKQPNIKFKIEDKSFIDLDKLEKKAEETRKAFAAIQTQRLNSGQIGVLTKDIVTAHERARQLETDIRQIKAELANPSRKSSIKFLTEELQAAEREADRLNRKLSSLPMVDQAVGAKGAAAAGLTSHQYHSRINLARQGADVFTMAGMGASPQMIAITQGPQIIDAMATSGIKFSGAMIASAAAIGTIAVAGFAIVQWTKSVREEAEKRLKIETAITAAGNQQALAQKNALQDFKEQLELAERARNFSQFLGQAAINDLEIRRQSLNERLQFIPGSLPGKDGKPEANPRFQVLTGELNQINAQIDALKVRNKLEADKSFNDRWEAWKRSQASAAEAAAKAARIQNEEIEKSIQKIDEFGKTLNSILDDAFLRSAEDNPIARAFQEGQRAVESLEAKLKELPPKLQAIGRQAVEMQQKLNARNMFSARVDNALSIFGLREDAANFRNPFDAEKLKAEQERFIQDFLKHNPNYLFLKQAEFEGRERESGYRNLESFDDFIRKDILSRGNFDTPQKRLNESLDQKFNLLLGNPFLSAEERAINQQKFLAATAGVNPLDLSDENRERAALVREAEATRRAEFDRKDFELRSKQLTATTNLTKVLSDLNQRAKNGENVTGKQIVEIVDRSGAANVLGASPVPEDMTRNYDLGFFGGSNR